MSLYSDVAFPATVTVILNKQQCVIQALLSTMTTAASFTCGHPSTSGADNSSSSNQESGKGHQGFNASYYTSDWFWNRGCSQATVWGRNSTSSIGVSPARQQLDLPDTQRVSISHLEEPTRTGVETAGATKRAETPDDDACAYRKHE